MALNQWCPQRSRVSTHLAASSKDTPKWVQKAVIARGAGPGKLAKARGLARNCKFHWAISKFAALFIILLPDVVSLVELGPTTGYG